MLEGGTLLEKAAVNTTIVRGKLSAARAQAMSSRGRSNIDPQGGQVRGDHPCSLILLTTSLQPLLAAGGMQPLTPPAHPPVLQDYAAAALSLVFHSAHPLVPTLRADVRLFEVSVLAKPLGCTALVVRQGCMHPHCWALPWPPGAPPSPPAARQVAGASWFGGGCDLTPFYLDEVDAASFHSFWKRVCDRHQAGLYPRLKQWCDKWVDARRQREGRSIGVPRAACARAHGGGSHA